MATNTTIAKQDTSESLKIELTEFLNLYPYRAPHIKFHLMNWKLSGWSMLATTFIFLTNVVRRTSVQST